SRPEALEAPHQGGGRLPDQGVEPDRPRHRGGVPPVPVTGTLEDLEPASVILGTNGPHRVPPISVGSDHLEQAIPPAADPPGRPSSPAHAFGRPARAPNRPQGTSVPRRTRSVTRASAASPATGS